MGIKNAAKTVFIEKLMFPFMNRFFSFEKDVLKYPQAVRFDPDSPKRFDIPMETLKRFQQGEGFVNRRFPAQFMFSIMRNMRKSVHSLPKNPFNPQRIAPEGFFQEFDSFAKSLGVSHVGFTKIDSKHVFQDMAVLYENAFVLAMEMDKDRIDIAPSYETMAMIMDTYDKLGIAANKIADYLRKLGYGAHATHPLGGLALYPPLGQMSGIGFHGRHGLIITPEFGPRVRLTAVFTSIQNIPNPETNEHEWIREYCDTCLKCVKMCPAKAILGVPIPRESGKLTYTDRTKCFPYFTENFGCSICIRVCPFSEGTYAQIKQSFIS